MATLTRPTVPATGGNGQLARRVAVIGGGYAGMSAAMHLVDAGIPVTVFEAGPVLGGRARRIPGGDGRDDNGQHLLLGAYTELLGLLRRLHVPVEEVLDRRPLTLAVAGGLRLRAPLLPAPWHLAAAILLASGAPLAERMHSLRVLDQLQRNGFRAQGQETVSDLLDRLGISGVLRAHLWEAICLAALNTPSGRACAQTLLNILHDIATGPRSHSDLLIPRTDLSTLFPEPAAEYVRARGGQVFTHTPVLRLEPLRGAVRVINAHRHGLFRRVIVATASRAVPRLLADWPGLENLIDQIGDLPTERIATLTLEYPVPVRLACPMMGVAFGGVEWVFDRRWLFDGPSAAPGRLACVLSAPATGEALDREALTEQAHEDVQRLTGPLPYPTASRLVVEKFATLSCRPGLARPDGVTHDPRILLAGDYLASRYPATLETAVRSGRRAATAAIRWAGYDSPSLPSSDAGDTRRSDGTASDESAVPTRALSTQ